MYAINETGYRAVAPGEPLAPGETLAAAIPAEVLEAIRRAEGRGERDRLLRGSDWTQAGDSPLAAVDRQAWASYRSALRDLPSLPGFPDLPWPAAPVLRDGVADAGVRIP